MQADAIVATRSNALSTLITLQSLGAVCERKIADLMQLHLKWPSLRCGCKGRVRLRQSSVLQKRRHICGMPFMLWVLSLHALPHLEHDNDNSLLGCHAAKWNVRGWNSGTLHERYKPTSCRCQGNSSAAFKPVRVALELAARLKFATARCQRSFLTFLQVWCADPAAEE